jgi:tetratricopeptide (TPR) repeat protein
VGTFRGQVFIAMEFIEGSTLRAWVGGADRGWRATLDAFIRAGRGLAAAHAVGVVHRDFKPDNVLVGKDGRVLVTDFGLARSAGPDEDNARSSPGSPATMKSTQGALRGTPAYMAPEQIRGQGADERSDQFAFCTALYEAVAGTRPYPGRNLHELRSRAESGEVEPPRKRLPGWLRSELSRGLRPDPDQRHPSMDELLDALEEGFARRRRRWLLAAGAAAMAVLAVLAVANRRAIRPPRSIAVLAPGDAAPSASSSWLSSAVGELLGAELGSSAGLRLAPAERGAAADRVLRGSYALTGDQLKVELSLVDASGRQLAAAQETGPVDELVPLAAKLADRLRSALGAGPPASPEVARGTFPGNAEAARLYVRGVSKLRAREIGGALEALKRADQLAPGNVRIAASLAEALTEQQADAAAREAAARAYVHKEELPPSERARLEITRLRALHDYDQAIAAARAFWQKVPDDLERGLLLGWQQLEARKSADTLETVATLRKLPAASDDVRVDLLEDEGAFYLGDYRRAAAVARGAYQKAEARGVRHAMAMARYDEGVAARHLGSDPANTRALLAEAKRLFQEAQDPLAATGADITVGTMMADAGDLLGARALFETALDAYRQAGSRRQEAGVLHNLAIVLRRQGDLPGAIQRLTQAHLMKLEIGDRRSAASSLHSLGGLRLDVGDLPGAGLAFEQAAAIRRELKDPALVRSLLDLCLVRVKQANLPEARKVLDQARAVGAGQARSHAIGLLSMESLLFWAEGRREEAVAASREQSRLAVEAGQLNEALEGESLLAQLLVEQGKVAEARASIERAQAWLKSSKGRRQPVGLVVAEAQVLYGESPRNRAKAVAMLRGALQDVTRASALNDQWLVRFRLAEMHAPGEGLEELAREARAQGFEGIAQRAEQALKK